MDSTSIPTVAILGVPVSAIAPKALDRWLRVQLAGPDCRHIVTFNPEYAMLARSDSAFQQALLNADLITADGVGITLAARFRRSGVRLPRITGVDLLPVLTRISAEEDAPLFLLGAGEGVAEAAAARLAERVPGARFAGWWADGSAAPADDAEALARITTSGARMVAVAYGAPGQIAWIERNRAALATAGVRLAIGVGGALDYWSGQVKLAPPIVRRLGFEWLYRLASEPWRWRRQRVLPLFALLAGIESAKTWLGR